MTRRSVRSAKLDARGQDGIGSFSAQQLEAVRRTQSAYGFRPEVWKLLGVTIEADEDRVARSRARRRRG